MNQAKRAARARRKAKAMRLARRGVPTPASASVRRAQSAGMDARLFERYLNLRVRQHHG